MLAAKVGALVHVCTVCIYQTVGWNNPLMPASLGGRRCAGCECDKASSMPITDKAMQRQVKGCVLI